MKRVSMRLLATLSIVAGAVTVLPSAPLAQSLDLYIGPGGPGIELRDRRRDNDDNYRAPRCSPRQAIRRAYRLGLRDPEIQSITRRQIVIDGIDRYGDDAVLYLANRRGCPRIG
jgi:hypothetical protein